MATMIAAALIDESADSRKVAA
jgi:hypothetical protein